MLQPGRAVDFAFKEREETVRGKAATGAGYTAGSSSKRNFLNHLEEVSLSQVKPALPHEMPHLPLDKQLVIKPTDVKVSKYYCTSKPLLLYQ